jgi:hypothetical protein
VEQNKGVDREDFVGGCQGGFGEVHCSWHTYVFNGLFSTTLWLCNHINSLIQQLWWGSKQGKRKVHGLL